MGYIIATLALASCDFPERIRILSYRTQLQEEKLNKSQDHYCPAHQICLPHRTYVARDRSATLPIAMDRGKEASAQRDAPTVELYFSHSTRET